MTMGRPTKLTPELEAKFCKLVADGAKDDAPGDLAAFRESCERARALAERVILEDIALNAGQPATDWKAQQWRLQVMNPRRFKPADKTQLTGADDGPIRLDLTKLSDAELERIANGSGSPSGSGGD